MATGDDRSAPLLACLFGNSLQQSPIRGPTLHPTGMRGTKLPTEGFGRADPRRQSDLRPAD